MRICGFKDNRLGLVKGDRVFDVSSVLEKLPKPTYPYPKGDPLIAGLPTLRGDIEGAAKGAGAPVNEVKFLSPVANPSKIIGTPTNYKDHIAEANQQRAVFTTRYSGSIEEQGLFLKANSALIGAGGALVLLDELGLVVKSLPRNGIAGPGHLIALQVHPGFGQQALVALQIALGFH